MVTGLYTPAIRLVGECLRAESADCLVVYWGMSASQAVPGEVVLVSADLVATLAGIPRLGPEEPEPYLCLRLGAPIDRPLHNAPFDVCWYGVCEVGGSWGVSSVRGSLAGVRQVLVSSRRARSLGSGAPGTNTGCRGRERGRKVGIQCNGHAVRPAASRCSLRGNSSCEVLGSVLRGIHVEHLSDVAHKPFRRRSWWVAVQEAIQQDVAV